MHASQFDSVSRLFALRRSRREAMAAAGGGLAALGLGRGALAQEATPGATPDFTGEGEGVPFMFVQTFGAGSLVPLEDVEGGLVLTADHLAGQTLYFSDRPERIVGMVSTETFLGAGNPNDGMGFTPVDPPNAALVLDDGTMVVIELIDPVYDAAAGMVTYQVHVLDDVDEIDLQLQQDPLSAEDAPRDFTAASLFIDDCSDGTILCVKDGSSVASFPSSFCFETLPPCCAPCHSMDPSFWSDQCNEGYGDCGGDCHAEYQAHWACPT